MQIYGRKTWDKNQASHSHDPAFVKRCSREDKISMVCSLWWWCTQTLGAYQWRSKSVSPRSSCFWWGSCGASKPESYWGTLEAGSIHKFIHACCTLIVTNSWTPKKISIGKKAWYCVMFSTAYSTVETRSCDGRLLGVGWIVQFLQHLQSPRPGPPRVRCFVVFPRP